MQCPIYDKSNTDMGETANAGFLVPECTAALQSSCINDAFHLNWEIKISAGLSPIQNSCFYLWTCCTVFVCAKYHAMHCHQLISLTMGNLARPGFPTSHGNAVIVGMTSL